MLMNMKMEAHAFNQGKYNRTETALESRARTLLASSIRTIGGDGGAAHRYVYPTACDGIGGFVDSTTTLVAARTFSKVGRSDMAWDFLRTLFSAQGSNGFLPRFVYLNSSSMTVEGGEGGDDGVVLGTACEIIGLHCPGD